MGVSGEPCNKVPCGHHQHGLILSRKKDKIWHKSWTALWLTSAPDSMDRPVCFWVIPQLLIPSAPRKCVAKGHNSRERIEAGKYKNGCVNLEALTHQIC